MSCVYDCLIREFKMKRTTPEKLLKSLKKNNRLTRNVLWNNEPLSEKELEDNFERIKNIEDTDGYDCSTCDPILFLMAEIHNLSITHDYNGALIKYTNINAKRRIIINSNDCHMF